MNLSFTDLNLYADMYISQMIVEHVGSTDTIPQTEDDLESCMAYIQARGITGDLGIATVTISQYFYLNENILVNATQNALDDILELIHSHYTVDDSFNPNDINQVCPVYINAYLNAYIDNIKEYVRSTSNYIRELNH